MNAIGNAPSWLMKVTPVLKWFIAALNSVYKFGTRGFKRCLEKSSKEICSRKDICIRFLDCSTAKWLKIMITWFMSEMAYFSSHKYPTWLQILNKLNKRNWSTSKWADWEFSGSEMNLKDFERLRQNLMYMTSREQFSFDDFFSH